MKQGRKSLAVILCVCFLLSAERPAVAAPGDVLNIPFVSDLLQAKDYIIHQFHQHGVASESMGPLTMLLFVVAAGWSYKHHKSLLSQHKAKMDKLDGQAVNDRTSEANFFQNRFGDRIVSIISAARDKELGELSLGNRLSTILSQPRLISFLPGYGTHPLTQKERQVINDLKRAIRGWHNRRDLSKFDEWMNTGLGKNFKAANADWVESFDQARKLLESQTTEVAKLSNDLRKNMFRFADAITPEAFDPERVAQAQTVFKTPVRPGARNPTPSTLWSSHEDHQRWTEVKGPDATSKLVDQNCRVYYKAISTEVEHLAAGMKHLSDRKLRMLRGTRNGALAATAGMWGWARLTGKTDFISDYEHDQEDAIVYRSNIANLNTQIAKESGEGASEEKVDASEPSHASKTDRKSEPSPKESDQVGDLSFFHDVITDVLKNEKDDFIRFLITQRKRQEARNKSTLFGFISDFDEKQYEAMLSEHLQSFDNPQRVRENSKFALSKVGMPQFTDVKKLAVFLTSGNTEQEHIVKRFFEEYYSKLLYFMVTNLDQNGEAIPAEWLSRYAKKMANPLPSKLPDKPPNLTAGEIKEVVQ